MSLLLTDAETCAHVVAGNDDDLEYYLRECGDILGITPRLEADKKDAKHVLEYVMQQVFQW